MTSGCATDRLFLLRLFPRRRQDALTASMGVYTCRNAVTVRENRGYVPDPPFEKPFCSRPTGALLVNCPASRRSITPGVVGAIAR